MAAVTGAMAQATIYGVIDQAITKSTTKTAGVQTANTTGMSAYQMGDSIIGFKGEEDLGGGLKASFTQEFGVQTQTSSSVGTRQAYVGLSGGFGALRAGKQYSAAFFNLIGSDPFGATSGSGALYVGNIMLGNQKGGDNPLRQDNAIQYEAPTFVPGVRIALTKVLAGADTGNGTGAKTGDSTGYALLYTSGPLNVGFTSDSIKAQSIGAIKSTAASGSVATGALVTTAAVAGVDAAATSTTKLTTFAAQYDLGMAKLTYSDAKIMNNGKGVKASMTGIAVPMGAATLMVTSSTGKADALAGETKLKGMQYGGNYALSKRTVAYLHINNSTSTKATVDTKVKGYGLGIHHSF
jgi:predicted porin